jgi:hypothetical protein
MAQAHKILVNALTLACQICPQARDRAQHERSAAVRAAVRRDGTVTGIPVEDVVPGDVASLARAISCQPTASCLRVGRRRIPTSLSSPASLTESRNEPAIVWLKTRLKPSMRCSVALPWRAGRPQCSSSQPDHTRVRRHRCDAIVNPIRARPYRKTSVDAFGKPRGSLSFAYFQPGNPGYLRDSHEPQRCP